MNSSLIQNGVVLTGKDLEVYSKRKGLCRICARVVTHKRAGKLPWRNQWKPLTIQDESTGEYLVYKGHCIQPTCYTLDEAKESLGEKPSIPRCVEMGGARRVGLLNLAPLLGKNTIANLKLMQSSKVCKQRLDSYQSDNALGYRLGLDPSESVNSLQASVSLNNKWSRETPMITLPSDSAPSSLNTGMSPRNSTGATTPIELDGKDIDKELAGAIANLTSMIYNSRHQRPSLETQSTAGKSVAKSVTKSVNFSVAPSSAVASGSRATTGEKKKDGILKKSMALFPGLKKGLQTQASSAEDHTIESSASSISSGSFGFDEVSTSQQSSSQLSGSQLPGHGFVVGVEGNYRAALEAMDVTDYSATGHRRFNSKCGDHFQALCLQSKTLDNLDIEMVAVEVDSENRHWMSREFLLDDDLSVWDYAHEHKIVQDLSGIHTVHLSHAYCSGLEELELEADLADFEALERVRIPQNVGKASSDFLIFSTRVSLEAEIADCRKTISKAEQSFDPSAIQQGIDARDRLAMLLPLRKFYLSRKELEKKVKGLSRVIAALGGKDLDRRHYLATQKEQLLSQVEEEKREEALQRLKAKAKKKELDNAAEPKIEQLDVNDGAATVANESVVTGPVPKASSLDGGKPEITSADTDLPTDAFHRGIEVNMTVFQSAPLAYVDPKTGTHHVCPLLDFEYEGRALTKSLKDAEIAGAKVDVEFDIATTDRLSAFLAKGESRVMHLSCHGHPDYLALENGFGGMQILRVRDLKRFIASGAGNLEVVFVSACHSMAAGKAFLDAGIRHVICCRQDDKFRDEGAIEFARSFYRALALNNTLKQAFKIAREAMRISPMVKDSKSEYEKFILLPELPANDPYHDVHMFLSPNDLSVIKRSPTSVRSDIQKKRNRILPRLPQYFVGRETDMYNILDALRSNDVVSIQGPPEVGKTSLVAALSRYIEQRHKSFLFDDVFWLPVQKGSIPPDDKLCLDLSNIFEWIKRASTTACDLERVYAEYRGRVLRQLHDKKVLLIVNGRDLTSHASRGSLEVFLRDLLRVSNAKIITVGVPVMEEAGRKRGPTTAVIDVEALDFDATVLLFARQTRSASASTQQIIKALTNFPKNKKQDPSQEKLIARRKRRTFERLGAGVPAAIRRAALEMSDDDVQELLRVAKRPVVDVDSRAELETKLSELEDEESVELKENHFLKARDIRETIEELVCLRQDFPTVEKLQENEWRLDQELQRAISHKEYDEASRLKKRLAVVQDQISKELSHERTRVERMCSF